MAENHGQVSRTAMMLSVKVTSDSKMTDCAPWSAIAPCYRDATHDTAAAGHKGRGDRGWVGCVLIAESAKAYLGSQSIGPQKQIRCASVGGGRKRGRLTEGGRRQNCPKKQLPRNALVSKTSHRMTRLSFVFRLLSVSVSTPTRDDFYFELDSELTSFSNRFRFSMSSFDFNFNFDLGRLFAVRCSPTRSCR